MSSKFRGTLATWTLALAVTATVAQGQQPPAEKTPTPEQARRKAEDLDYFQKEGARSGLRNIKIDTAFEFPRVIVTGFSADLGGGRVTGTGRVDLFNPLGEQRMKVAYRRVPLAAYIRSYLVKWDADITGTIDADLDLTWRGITRSGAKRTMSGTGTVRYSGGTIRRASAVADAARAVGLPRVLPMQLRSGEARGTISNGILTISRLRIRGANTAAEAEGTVNLSTGVADTTFNLFVNEMLGAKLSTTNRRGGASWAGAAGRVGLAVAISITGDLENPSIRVARR